MQQNRETLGGVGEFLGAAWFGMRDKFFRLVSAGLFGVICYVVVDAVRNGLDFTPSLEELAILASVFVFAPTFGVFAILGEKAAYRLLVPGIALLQLPQIVLEAIVRRTVVLPEYLRDPAADELGEGGVDSEADST